LLNMAVKLLKIVHFSMRIKLVSNNFLMTFVIEYTGTKESQIFYLKYYPAMQPFFSLGCLKIVLTL